ncbi:hypothetical protein AB0A77_35330 [Streptomyces varsoviensis]|uniref:hypothetical protein n=1 Tax=Streptomyces varsoviensis TaxID=67373 RepID=UPI0033D2E542
MRRTTIGSASATALCLGVLLTGCGSGSRDGYVAAEAAGPAGNHAPGTAVPPKGGVDLVPLDGAGSGSPTPGSSAGGKSGTDGRTTRTPGAPGSPSGSGSTSAGTSSASAGTGPGTGSRTGTPSAQAPGAGTSRGRGTDKGPGTGNGPGAPQKPNPPGTPGTTPPGSPKPPTPSPSPAALTVSTPKRTPADHRWCEQVTVIFTNTGGRPVTKGIVTFETHVIGALGVDWATIKQTRPLPAPIAAGQRREQTWPICVDAWRVPLGMHIETRDVTARWK